MGLYLARSSGNGCLFLVSNDHTKSETAPLFVTDTAIYNVDANICIYFQFVKNVGQTSQNSKFF